MSKLIRDTWGKVRSAMGEEQAIPDEDAGWVRARQLASFQNHAPVIIVANLMNAALMTGLMHGGEFGEIVLAWSLTLTALMLVFSFRLIKSVRRERNSPAQARSLRSIHANMRDTAIVGAIWGALPALCFSDAAPQIQMVIAAVAEGIETSAQLEIIQALGCDEIQGYLLSRPVALDALIAMIGAAPPVEIGDFVAPGDQGLLRKARLA
tara:strand:+ start:15187 stop:15813 length:627 start_codon:yes stop_codon:yes gene_type:complete